MPDLLTDSGLVVAPSWKTARSWEGKSNRVDQATIRPGLTGGQSVSRFRDFSGFLDAILIPYVYACVSVIAYNFAATEYHLREGDAEDDTPIPGEENHPLVQLMARPNPNQSGFELLELLATYLELTGNCYLALEDRDGYGRPREVYLLNPARVRIIPDPDTYIKGYVYDAGGATSMSGMTQTAGLIPYAADEIIHLKWPNPRDPYYGMGNVEAMQTALNTVVDMELHESAYWKSGGRIIGVLQTDTKLSDQDFNALREHWQLANSDQRNRRRIAILEQGLKYTPTAEGMRGLDLVNISKEKRDRILSVFGVPGPKVAIMEQAQYKLNEADEMFWQETMHPKFVRFEDAIQPLVDLYDPALRWQFQRRNYEDDTEKLQNAQMMFGLASFTVNELRAYLGLDDLGPDGDFIWTPTTMVPVPVAQIGEFADETMTPPEPSAPVPGTLPLPAPSGNGGAPVALADHVDGMKSASEHDAKLVAFRRLSALRGKAATKALRVVPPMERMAQMRQKRIASNGALPARRSVSQRHPAIAVAVGRARDQFLAQSVPVTRQRVRAAFEAQRQALTRPAVLKRLLAAGPDGLSEALRAAWPQGTIAAALTPTYETGIREGYASGARMLPPRKRARLWEGKKVDPLTGWAGELPPQDVLDQFPQLGERIVRQWQGIDDTTFEAIKAQLETGITRGYSPLQIASGFADEEYPGIAGVFSAAAGYRTEAIARTESGLSWNAGNLQAYNDAGVTQVEAVDGTAFDDECRERDGQVYDVDAGGEPIDNGYGTEDHPQGSLCWAPIAESITPESAGLSDG